MDDEDQDLIAENLRMQNKKRRLKKTEIADDDEEEDAKAPHALSYMKTDADEPMHHSPRHAPRHNLYHEEKEDEPMIGDGLDIELDTPEDKLAIETDISERIQVRIKGRENPSQEELAQEAIWITDRIFPGPQKTEEHVKKVRSILNEIRVNCVDVSALIFHLVLLRFRLSSCIGSLCTPKNLRKRISGQSGNLMLSMTSL